jgi:hypothetical protein
MGVVMYLYVIAAPKKKGTPAASLFRSKKALSACGENLPGTCASNERGLEQLEFSSKNIERRISGSSRRL